ncbi:MAG: hypothetical protein M3Y35_13995 [Actinomycetota bacterium]|nr:hypothetical protein [Actinomycetota bacterium]
MSIKDLIADAFLAISVVGFIVQTWALGHIRRGTQRPGLVRTAGCRVAAAVLYLIIGVNAVTWQWATLQVAFAGFFITQATWQINALMDVRLDETGKHRLGQVRTQVGGTQ